MNYELVRHKIYDVISDSRKLGIIGCCHGRWYASTFDETGNLYFWGSDFKSEDAALETVIGWHTEFPNAKGTKIEVN